MVLLFTQTDDPASCGWVPTAETPIDRPVHALSVVGGVPGVVELSPRSDETRFFAPGIQFEFSPGLVVWPVGDWVVRLNVTTAVVGASWTGVRVRRTRGCGVVETVAVYGSAVEPAVSIPMDTEQVETVTVPASHVTQSIGSVDDKGIVELVFGTAAVSPLIWGVTPDQVIDSPLMERANQIRGYTQGDVSAAESAGVVASS